MPPSAAPAQAAAGSGAGHAARCPHPPRHQRVVTLRASAIHTMPPCVLTHSSAACPCPRSRGGSTRYACTAWPCRPARAHQSAIGRSSNPNAATSACRGHPGASKVTRSTTVSARGAQPIDDGACAGAEGVVTRVPDEPVFLLRMDTAIALARLASGRTGPMGAACGCGGHDGPPGVVWKHAKRE
jgi:hypothetical protein